MSRRGSSCWSGKYFPTGAHKVGATFGPLVEKLVRGAFDPTTQKALWPSTGNYCRGGAYDAYLLACPSIAVLPEGMSRERFEWLEKVGSEIYATPGSEIQRQGDLRQDQGAEGRARRRDRGAQPVRRVRQRHLALRLHRTGDGRGLRSREISATRGFARCCLTQGSAGTLGLRGVPARDLSRDSRSWPPKRSSARPCCTTATAPTASRASATSTCRGSTTSRTWTWWSDIDDEACMSLLRLFNEPAGPRRISTARVSTRSSWSGSTCSASRRSPIC